MDKASVWICMYVIAMNEMGKFSKFKKELMKLNIPEFSFPILVQQKRKQKKQGPILLKKLFSNSFCLFQMNHIFLNTKNRI